MRNKHIDPIELTFMKRAVLYPVFFLSAALLVFSFFPKAAWAAAAPNAPTNLTATVVSSQQINLSWQDNATNEANYYVERAPASTGKWKVVATLGANVTSYQNTGLTQNTTYYYRVRCKAGNTYSSYSNTANAITAVIAAPTEITADVISASSISLAWTDNTAYESNYSVERSPNGSRSWTVIATLGANVTNYTNTGLTVGTAYYYRVRTYDGTNYSAYTAIVSQTIRTITASAGANGTISPSGTVGVANGSTQVYTMTPNTGYKIATVTVDGVAVSTNSTYAFSNVTVNHTISATFSVITFTITASAGANGSISPSGIISVNSGATTTFTITPNTGYHVSDVLVDGTSVGAVGSYPLTNVNANHTITASFAINTYTITATAGANGTISPSGIISVNYGATTTFTMTPNTGYHVSDVLVDGASVGAVITYTFTNVIANHTITASFAINTYTITASAGANGTISPSGVVSVVSGTTTTFTMTPNMGYHVSNVLVDGTSVGVVSTYTFTNVIANHTIAASFAINTFTITASAGANGTISPSSVVSISSGATTTCTITPNAGYHVSDVLVDGASVGAVSTYTFTNVTSNHTITASFAINTYTITASAGANGTISPSDIVSVNSGATVTFTITPTAMYHVLDVLVDGVSKGAITSYPFSNVTANHTISAIFEDDALIAVALSNVGVASNTLNTALAETATIFYTLNSHATVILKIIPEKFGPGGTPVYQASQDCPTAGAYLFTWAGTDSTGRVVPDEAYLYIMEASNGTSTTSYNPPAPTGTGSIICSQSGFDPVKNLPMTVTYTPAQPARVNINIFWWYSNYKMLDSFPVTPGSHTFDWDGRNPSNKLLDTFASASCSIASLLRDNYLITTGDKVKVTNLKTDPYAQQLSYGQFTRITYTLSREAYVSVKLTSPSGTSITMISNQLQGAGPQTLDDWNGMDAADTTGKKTLIAEEGDYMVSVQTVNPVTGTSSTTRANLRIGF
jgi:hypothetical protein